MESRTFFIRLRKRLMPFAFCFVCERFLVSCYDLIFLSSLSHLMYLNTMSWRQHMFGFLFYVLHFYRFFRIEVLREIQKKITLLFPKHRIKVAISHTVSVACNQFVKISPHSHFMNFFSKFFHWNRLFKLCQSTKISFKYEIILIEKMRIDLNVAAQFKSIEKKFQVIGSLSSLLRSDSIWPEKNNE